MRNAVDLALCLRDAGIRAIEVTLRTEAALKAIELIADAVPDISVGAGSVRSTEQITAIRERGLNLRSAGPFAKSIQSDQGCRHAVCAGGATASEILSLWESGYSLMKFFPCRVAGGTKC